MFPVQLKPGVRFMLLDKVFTILKRLPDSNIEAEEENFKTTKIFKQNELIKYLSNEQLKFECVGKNLENSCHSTIKTSFFIEDIKDSKHKECAIFRYEVLIPLLKLPYNERNKAIDIRVEEVNSWSNNPRKAKESLNGCSYYKTISCISVYRWLKNFTESNYDIRSLFPSYHSCGGKNKERIAPQITDMIKETISEYYNKKQQISIRELWFYLCDEISEFNRFSSRQLKTPPYSSLARYISKIPEYELVAKRIGNRTAENKFNAIGNGVNVSYPLERVEIDHTPVDVILVDENGSSLGRPYLILAIDKFSRQVLGFNIGISNGVGWPEVMLCLKHIMKDKSYVKEIYPFIENEWTAFGMPKTIVIDNGLEFKNNAMKDACYQAGFILQFCPPKVPQWKGSIERFFGTANSGLFHNMPGTTRSNPKKLGDDENPKKSACLTFSVFIALVHKWIVDVYSQDLNKGAGGIPALIWQKAIEEHPVAWPNNITEAAILLGRTAYRKISRRGIELNTLHYNGPELNKIVMQFTKENNGEAEDFLVKYDPQDLGEVYVYDHLINKKWIKVLCTNYQYAHNLSEWEHIEMKTYARKEFGTIDVESLAKSKAFIRKMIENGSSYTEKERARAKKTTSEREIEKKLAAKKSFNTEGLSSNPKLTGIVDRGIDNASDIGITIKTPNIIIPKELIINVTPEGNNVVEFQELPKRKNKSKPNRIQNEKVAAEDSDNHFSSEDLTGFGILSKYNEVDIND